MDIKRTVSLFIYLPENEEVVLSRRSGNVSRTGLLQATTHGQIEAGEDDNRGLARELEEETGIKLDQVRDVEFIRTVEVGQLKPERCNYYVGNISELTFVEMKKTHEVDNYVRVGKDDLNEIIPNSKAEALGLGYKTKKVMFDDELGVLREVFRKKLALS